MPGFIFLYRKPLEGTIFQATWAPHHILVDQFPLLMLRPDMHVMNRGFRHKDIMDCLHFCVSPSPLDVTAELILNALRFL